VCTNAASLPEIVRYGETGFSVPAHDPETLIATPLQLRSGDRLVEQPGAAAARDVTALFSWPTVIQACLGRYSTNGRRA